MGNFNTLRNIIILLAVLFFTACRSSSNSQYSSSGDIQSISSEDKYADVTQVGEIVDHESGQTIYVVSKNK